MKDIKTQRTELPSGEVRVRWLVWDRDQTRVIATGHTFEEAKRAAAAAGECSVILARVPPASGWHRFGRSLIYKVAVFIAPMPLLPLL